MPRLSEAKKDVISCEKLRGAANMIYPQMSEWGNPPAEGRESIVRRQTRGTETS